MLYKLLLTDPNALINKMKMFYKIGKYFIQIVFLNGTVWLHWLGFESICFGKTLQR